jgi:type III secretion protein T
VNASTTLAEALPLLLIAVALSVPRVAVFLSIVTLFPSVTYPRTLRTAIAIGLSAPVGYGVFQTLLGQAQPGGVAALALKEAVLGLLLATPVAAPFWVLQSVGALIDNQRGANAAAQLTPFSQSDSSVLGSALQQTLIVVLTSTGVLAVLYQLLLQSFAVWPVLELAPDLTRFGFDLAVADFDDWILRAVLYASPVIAVILLVDFAFALITMFAPQLQAYFAAMPIKSLAAITMLVLYLALLMSHADGHFREALGRVTAALKSRSP